MKSFLNIETRIQCDLFEYENGWRSFTDSLSQKISLDNFQSVFGRGNTIEFHYGNIVLPLDSEDNSIMFEKSSQADIFVFLYVCVENRVELEKKNYVFLDQLFQRAKEDSLFLFMDSSFRLWDDLQKLAGNSFQSFRPNTNVSRNAMFLWKKTS